MSKTVHIESDAQLQGLIRSSKIVVTDFYADWCGPCKQIAPVYEQLSAALSRPQRVTFTKVNVDTQKETAARYGITAMPTFMVFKNGSAVETVKGADPQKLQRVVQQLAAEAEGDGSGSSSGGFGTVSWLGQAEPRGYKNVTAEVDEQGLDLLNADSALGGARTLFAGAAPSALSQGKGKDKAADASADWVESDTDEQLMLYVPFRSTLKVHTVQLTSCPAEGVLRPRTLQLYSNRAHVLGFDEAEGIPATQTIVLDDDDWDAKTHTARLELRFVKFQNVTSLVLFVVDGNGDGERVRLDRIRIVGETGEKRDMGKLEKVGEGE